MSPGRLLGHDDRVEDEAFDEDVDFLEPIAIIGFSLRFPQVGSSAEKFWELLKTRQDAMTATPPSRFNVDAFYHPTKKDALNVKGANYIPEDEPLDAFDNGFFGISPAESHAIDPAQRILLETSYRAFENAGLRMEDLRGTRTSVHTGCFSSDYFTMMMRDSDYLPTYGALGVSLSMLASRISWFYDLRGPSVNLDSACSSSAMAIDMACQGLRTGESTLAVVAGSSLLFDPDYSHILDHMHMLSPDGKSLSFDEKANGYSRGEGVAVLLLKPVSQAVRDNDTIRAIFRATGSNQDGRTPGITQPSSTAQAELIRRTYRNAGLSLKHTRYFEAHGTGTPVGDPIEAKAIKSVFQWDRDTTDPLYIGSAKSHIGHLEGAAGIAGVIKAIMILESGVITPIANLINVNKKIDQIDSCLAFPKACVPWPQNTEIRRASVNSFGYGGSNTHLVLDDAQSYLLRNGLYAHHNTYPLVTASEMNDWNEVSNHYSDLRHDKGNQPMVLLFSAHESSALQSMIVDWQEYSKKRRGPDQHPVSIRDLAYTLDTRRSRLSWSAAICATSLEDLVTVDPRSVTRIQKKSDTPRLAFIFTGQGAQWCAMGRELFEYPMFARFIDEADKHLRALGNVWSVREELWRSPDESRVDQPEIAQPLTCILQIGLVDLLYEANVRAMAVVGHSMGEIAAAYCSGAISKASALRLCYYRGLYVSKVQERSTMKGGMLAVGIGESTLEPYMKRLRCKIPDFNIAISCFNSPKNLTLSGPLDQLNMLRVELQSHGVFARAVRVSAAYHSPQLECIVKDCLAQFEGLKPGTRYDIPMISTVTGLRVSHNQLRDPSHWTTNMIQPVEFTAALTTLCLQGPKSLTPKIDGSHHRAVVVDHLIEIGPHAALSLPVREILETLPRQKDLQYSSVLYRNQSASKCLLQLAGKLACEGFPVDLRFLNELGEDNLDQPKVLPDGPQYKFDHSQSFWHESEVSRNHRLRSHKHIPLLGKRSREWNPLQPQWRCRLRVAELAWVLDHRISSQTMLPASAMVSMAISAVTQLTDDVEHKSAFVVRNMHIKYPVIFSKDTDDIELRLSMYPIDTQQRKKPCAWRFSVFCRQQNHWTECSDGSVSVEYDHGRQAEAEIGCHYKRRRIAHEALCAQDVLPKDLYESWQSQGYHYGPSFQGITSAKFNGDRTATAIIDIPEALAMDEDFADYLLHPASLDTVMHMGLVALTYGATRNIPSQVPAYIDSLWISAAPKLQTIKLEASAEVLSQNDQSSVTDIFALDHLDSSLHVVVKGITTKTVAGFDSNILSKSLQKGCFYHVDSFLDIEKMPPHQLQKFLQPPAGEEDMAIDFWEAVREYVEYILKGFRHHKISSRLSKQQPHLARYLKWVNWVLRDTDARSSPSKISIEECRSRLESQGPLGLLYLEAGQKLSHILNGGTNLLDPRSNFKENPAGIYHKEMSLNSTYMERASRYIRFLALKNPDIKILDIGDGTRSFTHHIEHALWDDAVGVDLFSDYVYADISLVSLQRAQARLGPNHPKMIFKTLDIEQDPIYQGFDKSSFDIIVASNVLHATSSLITTMQRVRKLLKPGGQLILHEITQPTRIEPGFILGLTNGWWRAETDGCRMSRLLSEEQWSDLFQSSGFAGPHLVLHDFENPVIQFNSIFCATTVADPDIDPVALQIPHQPSVTLVTSGSHMELKLGKRIQEEYSDFDYRPVCISTLEEVSESEGASNEQLVFLIDIYEPFLRTMTAVKFDLLRNVFRRAKHVIWVSSGGGTASDPNYGMIDGFVKVLRIEMNVTVSTLTLECSKRSIEDQARHVCQIVHAHGSCSPGVQEEYCIVDDNIHIRRITEASPISGQMSAIANGTELKTQDTISARPFAIKRSADGRIRCESMSPGHPTLRDNEIEIEVQALGLEKTTLKHERFEPENDVPLCEGSGVVTHVGHSVQLQRGDRVCFLAHVLPLSNVRVRQTQAVRFPNDMDYSTAATLPKDLLVSYVLTTKLLRINSNSTVLIHGGSASFVRALLHIVQPLGPQLFITTETDCTTEELCQYQCTVLPTPCSSQYLFAMKPKGADVVIDIGMATGIDDASTYTSKFGQYFRLRMDLDCDLPQAQTSNLSKHAIAFSMTYDSILSHYYNEDNCLTSAAQYIRQQGMGHQKAPVFALQDAEDALEMLKPGYVEKTILELKNDDKITLHTPIADKAIFDATATYVVAGAFGALGQAVVRWMARNNAKYMILLSRSGARTPEAKMMLQDFRGAGIEVAAPICDISHYDTLRSVLSEISATMPRIKGCIQASGILNDKAYEKMDFEDWNSVTRPKVDGSWNLHEILPQGMDFFIMTSSLSGVLGQATQMNYAASSTYQDALARYRVSKGERAVSIDLGALLTGGLLDSIMLERFVRSGLYIPIPEQDVLALLEIYCRDGTLADSSSKCQVITGVKKPVDSVAEGHYLSEALQTPLWSLMRVTHGRKTSTSGLAREDSTLKEQVNEAATDIEAAAIVTNALSERFASLLLLQVDKINPDKPFHSLGADSLVAIEVRNWTLKNFEVDIPVFDLLGDRTINITATYLAQTQRSKNSAS
ncbi:hypothetical protein EJ05DRAFT_234979 [Pseudovirgaria hyperparasitica]|uniref:Uncharacterized protein n=1 Tax=Pseudovirgaria hyperparasitica TaxID=470096 RepID=A0A6A6VSV9_9PEZI|nr:uncharacterized protein EJ05DRAFT_234979 [Pseudovirgaria hyperparasitica]KAF2752844.1 hypothetical protein EJ05DRAFT_234979 [Pseudovirgaria hyperparasitica]